MRIAQLCKKKQASARLNKLITDVFGEQSKEGHDKNLRALELMIMERPKQRLRFFMRMKRAIKNGQGGRLKCV